tara:strand:+ start:641 stop:844 length:204 start_codon:yes stop_codon:yes gene_type:complete
MGANESSPSEEKRRTPKKQLSPYMKFCKETRAKIVEENPKLTFGEVGRKMGEMWREMSDDEKKKFST